MTARDSSLIFVMVLFILQDMGRAEVYSEKLVLVTDVGRPMARCKCLFHPVVFLFFGFAPVGFMGAIAGKKEEMGSHRTKGREKYQFLKYGKYCIMKNCIRGCSYFKNK